MKYLTSKIYKLDRTLEPKILHMKGKYGISPNQYLWCRYIINSKAPSPTPHNHI